jgi:hypothetical protein
VLARLQPTSEQNRLTRRGDVVTMPAPSIARSTLDASITLTGSAVCAARLGEAARD